MSDSGDYIRSKGWKTIGQGSHGYVIAKDGVVIKKFLCSRIWKWELKAYELTKGSYLVPEFYPEKSSEKKIAMKECRKASDYVNTILSINDIEESERKLDEFFGKVYDTITKFNKDYGLWGDAKLGNVVVDEDDSVKLIDLVYFNSTILLDKKGLIEELEGTPFKNIIIDELETFDKDRPWRNSIHITDQEHFLLSRYGIYRCSIENHRVGRSVFRVFIPRICKHRGFDDDYAKKLYEVYAQ